MYQERKNTEESLSSLSCGLYAIIAAIIAAVVVFLMVYTPVTFGHVKAVKRFGRLTGRTLYPGANFIWPWEGTEKITTIVRTYETSDNPDKSQADFTDYPVKAQTVDGQQLAIKFSLQFRVTDPDYVLENYGHEKEIVENIVKAHSRSLSRLVAQQYRAEDLYGGEEIFAYIATVAHDGITLKNGKRYESLSDVFDANGLELVDFLVRKIDFDDDYITAIEQQQIAEELIETRQHEAAQAEYEAERSVALATGEADAAIERARGEAETTRIQAAADAEAIALKGEALRKNPEVIEWEFIQNLEGVQWGMLPSESVTPLLPMPEFEPAE
jgi:regulator of protease activity HflC (stomatin/prohibitin superfamily)